MRRPTDRLAAATRRWLPAVGALVAITTLAACGSAASGDLPPAAGPDRSPAPRAAPEGRVTESTAAIVRGQVAPARRAQLRGDELRVELDPRARQLRLVDLTSGAVRSRITVGVGPTQVACAEQGPCFVTDTTGDALLVVRIAADGGSMRLVRRVYVAGAPYAIAVDRVRKRLWVTLTARDEVVELGAHGRPHILRRHPTVRQPDGVRVDEASGDVTIIGSAPPRLQVLTDPATPDRP
ncbi:MAG: hypothetical protein PGN13_00760 [Patulibacter minatonensis]